MQAVGIVPVQGVGRNVFRLGNVLGSGEFQARAADLLPGLQVGPDAVAAVVRVVQGQGVSVGKGPHNGLV